MALLTVVSWKKTWTRLGVKVAGSTGRSKVTSKALTIGVPSLVRVSLTVSPGSPTGPSVLEMIRGPAGMTTVATLMLSKCLAVRPAADSPLPDSWCARPGRIDVAAVDGQTLVMPKPKVPSVFGLPGDSLSGTGPRMTVLPVIASVAVWGTLA